MVRKPVFECSFFIPVRRDAELSDGQPHSRAAWRWLDRSLFEMFGGGTRAPGLYRGFYRDPDSGERVSDSSHEYTVAVLRRELKHLRSLLAKACEVFAQKCIYLSVAGRVEYIDAKKHEPG